MAAMERGARRQYSSGQQLGIAEQIRREREEEGARWRSRRRELLASESEPVFVEHEGVWSTVDLRLHSATGEEGSRRVNK